MNPRSTEHGTARDVEFTGTQLAGDTERFGNRLNDRVIQHLFSASIELAGLATALDDSHQVDRLLECIEDIDAAIARIRMTLFDLTSQDYADLTPASRIR